MPLTNTVTLGLCLANGNTASASLVSWTVSYTASNLSEFSQKFTSWTTLSANYFTNIIPTTNPYPYYCGKFFLRLRDDNTNRYFEVSADGRNWVRSYYTTVTRTDFITPTYGGIFVSQVGTSVPVTTLRAQAKIFHFYLGT
jgi:hypothetical protein